MRPPLAMIRIAATGAALLLSLAACGTKTALALPPGPATPPLLGGPAVPAPAKPAPPKPADNSAPAEQR